MKIPDTNGPVGPVETFNDTAVIQNSKEMRPQNSGGCGDATNEEQAALNSSKFYHEIELIRMHECMYVRVHLGVCNLRMCYSLLQNSLKFDILKITWKHQFHSSRWNVGTNAAHDDEDP